MKTFRTFAISGLLFVSMAAQADFKIVDGRIVDNVSHSEAASRINSGKPTIYFVKPLTCKGGFCAASLGLLQKVSASAGDKLAIYGAHDGPIVSEHNREMIENKLLLFMNGRVHQLPNFDLSFSHDRWELRIPKGRDAIAATGLTQEADEWARAKNLWWDLHESVLRGTASSAQEKAFEDADATCTRVEELYYKRGLAQAIEQFTGKIVGENALDETAPVNH